MHHSTRARASACRMPPGWFRSRFSYFRSYEPVYSCFFIARKQLRTTSGNRTRVPRPYQSAVAGCAAAAPSSLSAVLRRLPPESYNPGSMYSPTSFRWECAAVTPSKRVDDTSDAVRRHPTSSDWPDSNRRPPDPQSGALTKLRHNPFPAWGWIVRHPSPCREYPLSGVPEQAPERFHGGRTRNRTCRRPPDEPPTPSTNVGGAVGLTFAGPLPCLRRWGAPSTFPPRPIADFPNPIGHSDASGALRSFLWTWRGSNPLPSRCERDALPVELQAREHPVRESNPPVRLERPAN